MSESTKAVDLLSGDGGEEVAVPPVSAKDVAAKYSIGDDDDNIDKLEGKIDR